MDPAAVQQYPEDAVCLGDLVLIGSITFKAFYGAVFFFWLTLGFLPV
jgi:hypothetical protein